MRDNERIETGIDAIERALRAAEERMDAVQAKIDEYSQVRRRWLVEYVSDYLPSFSNAVLLRLREQLTGFVTGSVEVAFKKNRKFLGIFAGQEYKRALSLLRVRLASHLDQAKYGEIEVVDEQINELRSALFLLSEKIGQGKELSQLLQEASRRRIALSPLLAAQVDRFARPRAPRPRAATEDYSPRSLGNAPKKNDDDLMLFLLTDIPTSMRTLLLSAIMDERERERQRASDAMPTSDDVKCGMEEHGHDHGTYDDEPRDVNAAAATAVAGVVIATDDSLGLFS